MLRYLFPLFVIACVRQALSNSFKESVSFAVKDELPAGMPSFQSSMPPPLPPGRAVAKPKKGALAAPFDEEGPAAGHAPSKVKRRPIYIHICINWLALTANHPAYGLYGGGRPCTRFRSYTRTRCSRLSLSLSVPLLNSTQLYSNIVSLAHLPNLFRVGSLTWQHLLDQVQGKPTAAGMMGVGGAAAAAPTTASAVSLTTPMAATLLVSSRINTSSSSIIPLPCDPVVLRQSVSKFRNMNSRHEFTAVKCTMNSHALTDHTLTDRELST